MEYLYLFAFTIYKSVKSLPVLERISLIGRQKNYSLLKNCKPREHDFALKETSNTK